MGWEHGVKYTASSSPKLSAALPGSRVTLLYAIGHRKDGVVTQLTAQFRLDYSEWGGKE